MTDCEIMRLEKWAVVHIIHDEPQFSEMFVAHLLARTHSGRGGLGRSTIQFD
jgi:CRP/FNR family transcriptional regulator, cyclic AMP receptor protein